MSLDPALVAALRHDYRTAPIDSADRVMLDYVAILTRDATRVSRTDHDRLREAGSTNAASCRSR